MTALFRRLRMLLGDSAPLMDAAPPSPPDPTPDGPRLSEWTQRAYDRLVEAIGPGAANLSRDEIRTLVWLSGWDVTDNLVNIIRKARQG